MFDKNYLRVWRNPGSEWRSYPFWGWNAKLDKKILGQQIKAFKEAGVGGFFIHSRVGLETPYMESEWMESVKYVVQEAKRQGLLVWLYDEDGFPSGSAGGKVPAQGDAYRCKGLTLEIIKTTQYSQLYESEISGRERCDDASLGLIAVYAGELKGQKLEKVRRLKLEAGESFLANESLLVIRLSVSAPSAWFNHEAPPDNLNPDCVRKFIELTHEKYHEAVGEEFGKTIPGIFTDEPSLHDRHAYFGEKCAWFPWTYHFSHYFLKLHGYNFWEYLPWLYFDGIYSEKIRHDYWHAVTKRFGEAYFESLGSWCEAHHLLLTGHCLQEDKLGLAVRVNGGVMPQYEFFQIPGIDLLGEQSAEYLTLKQCASVAHQLGKSRVIAETYGCTGWGVSLETQKWIGDWLYVLGVNIRCQHIALYSLEGCRKRDYPPSIHYQNSWWKYYKFMEDYFARLSFILSQGEVEKNVLLIHPLGVAWSQLGVNPFGNPIRRDERDVPKLNQLGAQLNKLLEILERHHYDVELGDELLMQKYAFANNAQVAVGKGRYDAVVIMQPMDKLLPSTQKLLKEFKRQGGSLLQIQLTKDLNATWSGLHDSLRQYKKIWITKPCGEENTEILYQLRKTDEGYILFLVNHNRRAAQTIQLRLSFLASVYELDAMSGHVNEYQDYTNGAEVCYLNVSIEKCGSKILMLKKIVRQIQIIRPNTYKLSSKNVLPIDCGIYRMDYAQWSDEMEIWQIQKEIRESLGMRPIHLNDIEQRYRWSEKPCAHDAHILEIKLNFYSTIPIEHIELVMEKPQNFEIYYNGCQVSEISDIWFLDYAFKISSLGPVQVGNNEIVLKCIYKNKIELENIYLLGDFAVKEDRVLDKLPQLLPFGDWTECGLKHYSGNVIWYFDIDKFEDNEAIVLKLPEIRASYVSITINEHTEVLIHDFERKLDIGQWMKVGSNTLGIELGGSPRNMLGPFHLKEEPLNVNDSCFCPSSDKYSSAYLLQSYGVMGEIQIIRFFEEREKERK